jgi:hypothetical protein
MFIDVYQNIARYLLNEDSVAICGEGEEENAEEIVELMPVEYCAPMMEFTVFQ